MGKLKLYELAKQINKSSKELLEQAKSIGLELKSHLSSISDVDAEKLKKAYLNSNKEDTNKDAKKKEEQKAKIDKSSKKEEVKKDNPVIIRREVIIQEEKKQEQTNQKKEKENKNPFIQRNEKKDFNIVYRNKPQKPMTVSELFGLNKKTSEEKMNEKETVETEKTNKPEENLNIKQEQKIEEKKQETNSRCNRRLHRERRH